jgi:hypothetical protein
VLRGGCGSFWFPSFHVSPVFSLIILNEEARVRLLDSDDDLAFDLDFDHVAHDCSAMLLKSGKTDGMQAQNTPMLSSATQRAKAGIDVQAGSISPPWLAC